MNIATQLSSHAAQARHDNADDEQAPLALLLEARTGEGLFHIHII